MGQIIGQIPEFTDGGSPEGEHREVDQTTTPVVEETVVDEKETPATPAEKPVELTPNVDTEVLPQSDMEIAIAGLQQEKVKLLKEIVDLRGQKREIKQTEIQAVQKGIDELKDLHPDDVSTIDRVLRAKGYLSKEEANKMFYDAVKNEELEKFLNKYPEYKPENDSNDANWNTLQKELAYYKMPESPRAVAEILERAHRQIVRVPSGPSPVIQKRQVALASVGSGGAQRPSTSVKTLDPAKRQTLVQGGWSEDEIKKIEERLSE